MTHSSILTDLAINKDMGAKYFSIDSPNNEYKGKLFPIDEINDYIEFMVHNNGVPLFYNDKRSAINLLETEDTPNAELQQIGITLGFKVPPKIDKDPKDLTELDKIKNREVDLHIKLQDKDYYGSDISRQEFRELNQWKQDYLEANPDDYRVRGANVYSYLWSAIDGLPLNEKMILKLTGEGYYYEQDLNQYEKAIDLYNEAYDLTWETMGDKLQELIDEYGDREYLYTGKLADRIRICENKIFRREIKRLEAEAKELEEISPAEAIKKYEELNKVNPGLKKYDKRIYRMRELEAKNMEETDHIEAIKIYSELNILNPGLKKYNKRIEILKKKLE